MSGLRYLLGLNFFCGFVSFTILLNAGQSCPTAINLDQSKIDITDATSISPVLKDFVQQAIQQGLSVDQIVEQAAKQGHARDQVFAVCLALIAPVEKKAPSTRNTLVWFVVGAAMFGIGFGIGAWFLEKWLASELVNLPDNHVSGMVGQDNRGPQAERRDFHIAPVNRDAVGMDFNERINDIIDLGLFRGANPEDIIQQVRRRYPYLAIEGHFAREDGRIVQFQEEPFEQEFFRNVRVPVNDPLYPGTY